ncbi:MAG: ETC complex I subunit [Methylovirgula sp.]
MTARIYRPTRAATQSGEARSLFWILEFAPATPQDIDPLMGWTGSADMKRQIRLSFGSEEEAIAYARKNGLAYRVEQPAKVTRKIMAYADNFKSTRHGLWTH